MSITIDKVVEAYVRTRGEIQALEEKIKRLKSFQLKKEEWLQDQMIELGVESFKTAYGTAYSSLAESVTVADWDSFFTWVQDNDKYEFLEHRVSKTEVLNMMGERGESGRPNSPPPGVNFVALRKVGIRKA